MVPTSPVTNPSGATDERETQSVNTTCAAGVKRDVMIVMKEIAGDQETVLSKERGNDVTATDQKMVIIRTVTTQSRITDGSQERRRKARP